MATELKFTSDMKEVKRDLAQLQKAFDKQTAKLSKMQDQARQGKKGLKDMGKAGGDAASSISKVAGAWLSVGAAIGLASKALSFNNDLNEKAADMAKQSRFSLGALSQLAGGDQKAMSRMITEAKKTSAESGVDLNMAAKLQFNLESLLIPEKRKMFSDLVGTVEDPGQLAEGAVTLQTSFGEKETGGVRNILNKGLAASSVSKTTLEQMTIGLAQTAPSLGAIGASDEEGFAALAVLSKARKSSEQAATEIEALSAALMKQGLAGQGLFQGIDTIQKKLVGKTDKEKLEFFGRKEGFKGFQTLLAQGAEVQQAFKKISESDNQNVRNDNVAQAIRVRQGDALLGPTEKTLKSEQKLNLSRLERRGVGELTTQGVIDEAMTLAEGRGETGAEISMKAGAMKTAKWLGLGPGTVAGFGGAADFGGNLYRATSNVAPPVQYTPRMGGPEPISQHSPVGQTQSEKEGGPIFRMIADFLQKIETNTANTEKNSRPNGGGGNVRQIPLNAGVENN